MEVKLKTILLTGVAGFIEWKTAELLLNRGFKVIGIDNMNDYYDVRLKDYRLSKLNKLDGFTFYKEDIENIEFLKKLFKENGIDAVVNLAARAGVRYSLENPFIYMTTNAIGTLNLLECCRQYGTKKFVLASTSSIYAGSPMPFKEDLPVNRPISPYAASKKAAEAICYAYHYLYGIDITILRYFTVYGPAGRPDMSIFRFIKWIDEGRPVEIFGDGRQSRDFTYIDDIAEGTIRALRPLGYEIVNLGNNHPNELMYAIELIERYLEKKAHFVYRPFHKADLKATCADIKKAKEMLDWEPKVSLEEGIKRTVDWYKENRSWLKDIVI